MKILLTFFGKNVEFFHLFEIFGNTFSMKIFVGFFLGRSSRKLASPSKAPTGVKEGLPRQGKDTCPIFLPKHATHWGGWLLGRNFPK